jgi:hypothetical protein
LFNIIYENDFLNKNSKMILVPSSYFPLLSQFHYSSLLNDIQVEILIFGQQMRMYINELELIYFPVMDEFHPMNYLFNLNHKWNLSMAFIHMKSFIYAHIHPCRWINITLNFKVQAQASHSCTNHPPHCQYYDCYHIL